MRRAISVCLVLAGCAAPAPTPEHGVQGTFSIVAVDPEAGVCGAAVASKYPAVGKVVPWARAGVGAYQYVELDHPAKGAWSGGKKPFQHPCPGRAK